MYPNLYYVFKDLFGVEWKSLSFINTFGLLVAIAFMVAAWVLSLELSRKEKLGLLSPLEETITVGKPASLYEIISNGFIGFLFGYKLSGMFFSKPENMNPQDYIFSSQGNLLGGILFGAFLGFIKWQEKNKVKLKQPERRMVRIWPHDRVGDIIVLGLVFGILGAKLFDNFEHWDDFVSHPLQALLSPSGLTFYGGLILAAVAILIFASKKQIAIQHLVDAAAPTLMIAYAIGRLGCQISGDGDWGIYNSAYVADATGKVRLANEGEFKKSLQANTTYFLQGSVINHDRYEVVTDRKYASLDVVPHYAIKAPSFVPVGLFAYTYPQNVNKDGILMLDIMDEHNRMLPLPVFPTPLYETIICSILFLLMWILRRRIATPLVMFGIYLIANGMERIVVEMIRVNKPYSILGIPTTQAQFIAFLLVISGIGLILFGIYKKRNLTLK